MVCPGLIIEFLLVCVVFIYIAYVTVVEDYVGSAEYCTTFATAIYVTLNGRVTGVEAVVHQSSIIVIQCRLHGYEFAGIALVIAYAHIYVGCAWDIHNCFVVRNITDSCIYPYTSFLLLMLTYAALPAAAIDVTGRTARYVGCSIGYEVFATVVFDIAKLIEHSTYGACCIDILLHRTTHEGYVCSTVYVAVAEVFVVIATTAAIGVALYCSALIDEYVGVMLQAVETHFRYSVLQTCCVVLCITISVREERQSTATGYSYLFCSCYVSNTTLLATAIYLIYYCAILEVHLGIVSPCVETVACTIYGSLIALSLVRPYWCGYVNMSIQGLTYIIITTIESAYGSCLTIVVYMTFIYIAHSVHVNTL